MRKALFLAVLLPLLAAAAGDADAAGLKVRRQVRPYDVEVEIDRNPLAVGSNRIEIGIRDASGRAVTDAGVLVNYYMPPMPRMAPMNYTTKAGVKGGRYRAALDIIMAGPWYIRIIIRHRGSTVTTRLNVDAQ